MTTPYKLIKQKNGNYTFIVYSDGTKFRQEVKKYEPLFPETMDVKITNYCDLNCPFCHENSNREGKHANLLDLSYWDGVGQQELAIGGGNPLSHPDLEKFLYKMKERGKICNITVNSFHFLKNEKKIKELKEKKLIWGIGISYNLFFKKIKWFNEDMVLHVILGVHRFTEIKNLLKYRKIKVLLLGFKKFGRGVNYKISSIEEWQKNWQSLPTSISLDNLAIKQLKYDIKKYPNFYLGEDGRFSMYVDLVKKEYSISSFNEKRWKMTNCLDDFRNIRKIKS